MNRTLPFSAYSDAAILAREAADVFADAWHYVGHVGDLGGDDTKSLPITVNGLPVVLTNHDDDINALVNVCAHRGSIVCKEASNRESLTCPYHAWRYDLSGSLLSAPRSNREPDFDPEVHGLEKLPLGRWGPFIFVSPAHGAMPFEEFLGDLPDLVKRAGIDVDAMVFHNRTEFELQANWKLVSENFLECYHCRVAHPDFAKAIDTSPDTYILETAPTFSTQYGPVRSDQGVIDLSGEIERAQFHLLYPNTAINILAGQPNLSIGPIMPTGPATTGRFLDYFFGPNVSEDWIESMMAFDDQVGAEDKVLVEAMQVGVSSRPERSGTLFMDSENLIDHFEGYLRSKTTYDDSA